MAATKRTTKSTTKSTTKRAASKAAKSTKAAKPAKSASKATAAATDAQKARGERWQAAMKAGQALKPRSRNADGLSNKDFLYRAFVDHLVSTGEAMTTDQMKEVIGSYSPSKYSAWRNAWRAYFEGDATFTRRVPTNSREYRPTKRQAAANVKSNAQVKALKASA